MAKAANASGGGSPRRVLVTPTVAKSGPEVERLHKVDGGGVGAPPPRLPRWALTKCSPAHPAQRRIAEPKATPERRRSGSGRVAPAAHWVSSGACRGTSCDPVRADSRGDARQAPAPFLPQVTHGVLTSGLQNQPGREQERTRCPRDARGRRSPCLPAAARASRTAPPSSNPFLPSPPSGTRRRRKGAGGWQGPLKGCRGRRTATGSDRLPLPARGRSPLALGQTAGGGSGNESGAEKRQSKAQTGAAGRTRRRRQPRRARRGRTNRRLSTGASPDCAATSGGHSQHPEPPGPRAAQAPPGDGGGGAGGGLTEQQGACSQPAGAGRPLRRGRPGHAARSRQLLGMGAGRVRGCSRGPPLPWGWHEHGGAGLAASAHQKPTRKPGRAPPRCSAASAGDR